MDPDRERELTAQFISRLEELGYKRVESEFVKGTYGSEGSSMHNRVNIWLLSKRQARTSRRALLAMLIAMAAIIIPTALTIIINIDKVVSFLQKIGLMKPPEL